jgi:acyl dehydratase
MDHPRYAEDIRAGDSAELGSFTLSRAELMSFAERWDPQGFHIDQATAEAGRFGDVIASGVQSLAIFQRLCILSPAFNWAVIAGTRLREVRFRRPVYPDTTLYGGIRVQSVDIDQARQRATVCQDGWLDDAQGRVFDVQMEILVHCRPALSLMRALSFL